MSAAQEETTTRTDMFTNEFSREVFESKYKYGNETVEDMQARVAKAIASFERDKEHWEEEFRNLLADFKFIPGGRILSNAGIPIRGTTLINCYVSGFDGEDRDSMESILDELRRQALILKSEGGYGFCVDTLRPRYSFISGIGSESPGAVKMLDMWDTQSDVITSGSGKKSGHTKAKSGIRKGAQMVTMSIWHPDIEEFITAKQTPGRLTKFNMSVLITDKFIQAARSHSKWDLIFPDIDADKETYHREWDGNIDKWISKGRQVKVYKTFEDAAELWDMITNSTYTRNEPGILFIDRINHWNNLSYIEYISSTNPSLRKDTPVLTRGGIFGINELEGKNFQVRNLRGEWQLATCRQSGKNKQLYRVTLSNGAEYYSTEDHKWPALLVGGGFGKIKTSKLSNGNILPFNEHVETIDFEIENELSRETGFMLGWLYGDGCITEVDGINQYCFIFSEKEKYVGEYLLQVINQYKINESFLKQKKDTTVDSCYSIQIRSKEFHEYMQSLGVVNKSKIPSSLMSSGDSYIKGFIDGIYSSDGCISFNDNAKSPRIALVNKHLDIITAISDILGFYGIKSIIAKQVQTDVHFPNGKNYDKNYTRYTLYVTGHHAVKFAKTFRLTNDDKQSNLNRVLNYHTSRKNVDENLIRVISVEPTDMYEDVWDITVYDDTHCFALAHCITGNCGEQPLPTDGACLLGNLNLTQFVSGDDFDYDKLANTIKVAVRFMDNVNDITYVPLEGQRDNLMKKRRIGLGIMGYASALVMMKVRYGSPRALQLTDELMHFITNTAYTCSAFLASEKGAFSLYDESDYLSSNFVKTLDKETIDAIAKHGIRNSHLISIQPTGNTSSLANVVSGGLEPIFRPEYVRTAIVAHWPDYVPTLSSVDFAGKRFECTVRNDDRVAENGNWEWIKEGDDNMLRGVFLDGDTPVVYKYDQNRGLTRESVVMDYGVAYLKERGEFDPDADYMVDTAKLSIEDHVNTMTVIAKYVDAAMSKTINIPNDYSFEDFKGVYDRVYDSGVIKGCTTYRDGTMASVLSDVNTQPTPAGPDRIARTKAPKRPKVLECDIHHLTIGGDKWLVFIGLYGSDPYEVFAFKRNGIQISPKVTSGKLIKVKQRNHQARYDLDLGDITIEDVCSHFKTGEESALTRMISTALRHGADMDYIYDQLMKAEGSIVSFSKAVARAIKKYVRTVHDTTCWECGAENAVIMTEGCMKCSVCGASKC